MRGATPVRSCVRIWPSAAVAGLGTGAGLLFEVAVAEVICTGLCLPGLHIAKFVGDAVSALSFALWSAVMDDAHLVAVHHIEGVVHAHEHLRAQSILSGLTDLNMA